MTVWCAHLCNIGQRNTVTCRFDENVWKWLLLPLIVFIIFKSYSMVFAVVLFCLCVSLAYRVVVFHVFVVLLFSRHISISDIFSRSCVNLIGELEFWYCLQLFLPFPCNPRALYFYEHIEICTHHRSKPIRFDPIHWDQLTYSFSSENTLIISSILIFRWFMTHQPPWLTFKLETFT